MTLEDIIDKAQQALHDDGVLWPRVELLEFANDGYRQLLANSQSVQRPYQYDLPPRTAWAATQEWEDIADGTFQRFTLAIRNYAVSYEWEIEQLENVVTPANSYPAVSQLWETAYTDDTNRHFRFIVSKAHDRPIRVYFNDKQLTGTSDRNLDLRDTRWWREGGSPIAWLKGDGRDASFEVFESTTDYTEAYYHKDASAGIPREFSGLRTYTTDAAPYGLPRRIYSDDRQYLAAPYDGGEFLPTGVSRDFKSGDDGVTLWETIVPTRNLTESDVPVLLPASIHKYLKFYVLSKAFQKKGEGQRGDIAEHYTLLFQMGLNILTELGNLTFIDRVFQREEGIAVGRGRPPRVRLPSTYPAVDY